MTEWQLQHALTNHWATSGVKHGDERLMLVAWEVMFPSWKINDAGHEWNEPSIDFIAIDTAGRLVAIELKTVVRGVKPAWAVLCQVTHRAICAGRTVKPELLEQAHETCMSGAVSRVAARPLVPIWERHAEFFDLAVPLMTWAPGIGRIVAATRFADRYAAIEDEFNANSQQRTNDYLKQQYGSRSERSRKEFDRLAAVQSLADTELPTPVEHLQIPALEDLDL